MCKKSFKVVCFFVIAVFMLSIILSGCGSSNPSKVSVEQSTAAAVQESKKEPAEKPTIRFAHYYSNDTGFNKRMRDELDVFAEKNKDMANFTYEVEQGDNLRNKIKIDLASNTLPDVFTYWMYSSLKPMVDADLILEIHDYLNANSEIKWDMYPESAWGEFTGDGKNFYGVPTMGFVDYYLCNKDLFKKFNLEYPKTYDDLLAVSKVFAENGIIPLAVGSKAGNPAHFLLAELFHQYGTSEFMNKITTGEEKFDSPDIIKTANIVLDMAKNKVFPKDTIGSGDFAPAVALYNSEKAAMILGQTWSIKSFKPEIAEKSDFIPIPKFSDAKYDPAEFIVGSCNGGIIINKKSFNDPNKQKSIVALVDFINSDDVNTWCAEDGNYIMKKIKVDPSKVPDLYNRVLEFSSKQDSVQNFWTAMPDPKCQEALDTALDELWAQTITAEQFTKKVQTQIDKSLGK